MAGWTHTNVGGVESWTAPPGGGNRIVATSESDETESFLTDQNVLDELLKLNTDLRMPGYMACTLEDVARLRTQHQQNNQFNLPLIRSIQMMLLMEQKERSDQSKSNDMPPTNNFDSNPFTNINSWTPSDGQRVVLRGLVNSPHLNGRMGERGAYNEEADRYIVTLDPLLDGKSKRLFVRSSNIMVVSDE